MVDNLGWCKPYESKDGRASFVMCEGHIHIWTCPYFILYYFLYFTPY